MRTRCARNALDLGLKLNYFEIKNGVIMGRLVSKRNKTHLSGPAGNVEFYTIGNITYFKSYAKTHKKSRTKKAVTGRHNFKSVVNFAKGINNIPVLKEIWSSSSLEGRNAYQKLIKYNMPLAYNGNLSIKNFVIPKGHKLYIPEFSFENNFLNFTFDMCGLIKPPLTLHIFYYLYNFRKWRDFVFEIQYKTIKITPDNMDEVRKKGESKYLIKRKLERNEISDLSYWKDVVVFLAVTGTSSIANRKYWTDTVAFDIPLI